MNIDRFRFKAWGNNQMWEPFNLLDLDEPIAKWPKGTVLLQCTGLKDKKGILIWEGDLLKHDLWGISEIVWEEGMFRGNNEKHDITLAHHQLKRSKVIGNIYEHSHLITPAVRADPPTPRLRRTKGDEG